MKQLSVFIENREGRLEDVLNLLKEKNINIISLSLADTSDYGMLRLIVSDPQKGREALKENGFSATLNDVVAVTLPHKVGALQEILHVLCKESLNVEYMYALCTKTDEAASPSTCPESRTTPWPTAECSRWSALPWSAPA